MEPRNRHLKAEVTSLLLSQPGPCAGRLRDAIISPLGHITCTYDDGQQVQDSALGADGGKQSLLSGLSLHLVLQSLGGISEPLSPAALHTPHSPLPCGCPFWEAKL